MKLLIYSHAFAPQVGGIETFVMYLARGLVRSDSEQATNYFTVTVVTQTPGTEEDVSNGTLFRIVRKPGA
jgi:hypothetical protein